jgi:hypothetical protein
MSYDALNIILIFGMVIFFFASLYPPIGYYTLGTYKLFVADNLMPTTFTWVYMIIMIALFIDWNYVINKKLKRKTK